MLTLLGWLAVVVLIAANAVFVAAEFGLTSVDRSRVARDAEQGDRRAMAVHRATSTLSFQLSGAQLGITVCSLLLGFVAEPVVSAALHPLTTAVGLGDASEIVALILGLLLATVAQMLFGELVPQNLALARSLATSRRIVPLLLGFTRVFRPVIASFNGAANWVVRALGVEPQEELRSARSPAELRYLISSSAAEGALPTATADLLRRSLSFGDKIAADVMTPRVDVVALPRHATAAELLTLARTSGRSRFPVYGADLDDITGVVHLKHAYGVELPDRAAVRVDELMVEAERVPTTLHCEPLLHTLRRGSLQLAVIIDEFGGTAGVVTVEDLIEEITGPIRDEYDIGEVPEVIALTDGRRSVSGRLHRDNFAEVFGWPEITGPFDTLAGLVLARLGHLPGSGECVTIEGWTLTVDRLDGRRIDRLIAAPPAGEPQLETEEDPS
ncbi:MAG TPA: hemolysin family protein [Jatrophihabitans sp.]|uniref:hemolysin family protein n=1 Tax=Jatrophihabitans sp. TaxID=1932789 RepID=UPI002F1CDE5B